LVLTIGRLVLTIVFFSALQRISLGKPKEKRIFLLLFPRLFVPLAIAEGTFAQKSKRKTHFSFAIRSLIRTFAPAKAIWRLMLP